MANLKRWLTELAEGEAIEAVCLGHFEERDGPSHRPWTGRLLTWPEAVPHLDYEFYSGLGAAGCHPVFAWTRSWLIAVSEYDGATKPIRLPRHPCPGSVTYVEDLTTVLEER